MFKQSSLDQLGFMLRNKQKYQKETVAVIEELKFRTATKHVAKAILEFEIKDFIETPDEINLNRLYAMSMAYQAHE